MGKKDVDVSMEDDEDGCFLTEEEILSASAAAQAKAAGNSAAGGGGGSGVGESAGGMESSELDALRVWERCSCGADNEQAEAEAAAA